MRTALRQALLQLWNWLELDRAASLIEILQRYWDHRHRWSLFCDLHSFQGEGGLITKLTLFVSQSSVNFCDAPKAGPGHQRKIWSWIWLKRLAKVSQARRQKMNECTRPNTKFSLYKKKNFKWDRQSQELVLRNTDPTEMWIARVCAHVCVCLRVCVCVCGGGGIQ